MRWTRRPRLPAEVRAGLPLEPRERVLAAGRCEDGTWVTATDRALLVGPDRVEWTATAHAEWDSDLAVLSVDTMAQPGAEPVSYRLALVEPGLLPETVRERVTASIVASRHVRVAGRSGVRVVARRAPGSAELTWQVVVDAGLDPDDRRVHEAARSALAALRTELGG